MIKRRSIGATLAVWGVAIGATFATSCSILATRPVQDMSDTAAAIRAAREVQADTLAPELYRQSNEWFFRAKREYRFKNFQLAKDYAKKARVFAEQAEFESIRNGGNRTEQAGGPDPFASLPSNESPPPPPPPGGAGAPPKEEDTIPSPPQEPQSNPTPYVETPPTAPSPGP